MTHVTMTHPDYEGTWDAPEDFVPHAEEQGWTAVGDPGEYDGYTKADLEREIDIRNESRTDEERLSKSGNKADLLATLTADDGRRS